MPITATPILDRLLFDKLVSQEHHDLARQRLDALPNEPYSNTGEALIWLRTEDILSDSDLEEMETLSMSQAGFAGNAARIEAVGQLHVAVQFPKEWNSDCGRPRREDGVVREEPLRWVPEKA